MRICSFLPSATEIVYALGLGDALYGVSHECDYPSEARRKPRIVRSRFETADRSSAEIHRLVADSVSRGEPIYEVDLEVMTQARPDLVITQELCDVCAVSAEDVRHAVASLDPVPRVVSLDPASLGDVLRDIETVGEIVGRVERARELTGDLQRRIDTVRSMVSDAGASEAGSRPRVACIEWLDPLIVAGHWIPEMVAFAGGTDGLAEPGAPSRTIDMDELAGYAPEVLILMPCGMDVSRGVEEFSRLRNLEDWRDLPAVRNGRVYAVDAGGLFSRSGPRLVDGLEVMARVVHPDAFPGPPAEEAARRVGALSAG
jgi:iron complex transport system substrate-binding protein